MTADISRNEKPIDPKKAASAAGEKKAKSAATKSADPTKPAAPQKASVKKAAAPISPHPKPAGKPDAPKIAPTDSAPQTAVKKTIAKTASKTTPKTDLKKTISKTAVKKSTLSTTLQPKPSENTIAPEKSVAKTQERKRPPISTATISKVYYRIGQRKIMRNRMANLCILTIISLAAAAYILIFMSDRRHRGVILDGVAAGLTALEKKDAAQAISKFDEALRLYSYYHVSNPEWWVQADALVFPAVLRMAQGWRSLGNYAKALETFRQVSLHNPGGSSGWIGELFNNELVEFISSSHWTPEEQKELYQAMLKIPAESWDAGAIMLVRATEWAGLNVHPMIERLQNADLAGYGKPFPLENPQASSFRMQVMMFYKVDRIPEIVRIQIPTMPDYQRKRLEWYLKSNIECLLFGQNAEGQIDLNGIEGILLSEKKNVDEFNSAFLGNVAPEMEK